MRRVALILMTVLFFSACGDGGLVMPSLSEDDDFRLQTVVDGSVVTRNQTISATLLVGPGGRYPDRVEVTFIDQHGEVAAERTISAAEIDRGRLPALAVDQLATGFYAVRFELFEGGRRDAEFQRNLFVSDAPFAVASISAYPPTFMTDSKGILRADLDIPAQADPFLRWSFNGKPVMQGLLSAGSGELMLRSPQSEGVYPVLLELFPVAPRGADFSFTSQVSQQSDLVVKESRSASERGFGPPQSYYVLLHFAGNTRDSGMRGALLGGAAASAQTVGAADLRIVHELFGYYLDGATAIGFEEVILPFTNGALEPFSIAMRLALTEPQRGRVLFSARSDDSSLELQLELADEGEMRLHLAERGRGATVTSEGAALLPGRPVDINVAVVPHAAHTSVTWFVDCEPVGAADIPLGFARPNGGPDGRWQPLAGRSVIGGEGGFIGVIDEFGIFFRDEHGRPAANTAPFRVEQLRRHGEALIFAEGFERPQLPQSFATRGVVRISGGTAVVEPGSALIGPAVGFDPSEVTLELSVGFAGEPAPRVELLSVGDDARLLSHALAGPGLLRFQLERRADLLWIRVNDRDPVQAPVPAPAGGVRLEVVNDSGAAEVLVDSLLAFHGTTGIRQSLHVP